MKNTRSQILKHTDMEIINENKMPENNPRKEKKADSSLTGNIYLGVILICVGALWLFKNLGWIGYGVWDFFISWQMLLVVIGGYLLAVRKWVAGAVIGGIGILGLFMDFLTMRISMGPLVVIAIGLAIVITKLVDRDKK